MSLKIKKESLFAVHLFFVYVYSSNTLKTKWRFGRFLRDAHKDYKLETEFAFSFVC